MCCAATYDNTHRRKVITRTGARLGPCVIRPRLPRSSGHESLASTHSQASPPPGLMWSVSQPCFLWGMVRIAVRKLGLNCLRPNSEISLFPSLLTFSSHLRKADPCSEMFLRSRKWPGFQRVGPASWRMTAKTKFPAVAARPALGPGSPCLLGPTDQPRCFCCISC